jgi:hypothetical protein
LEQYDQPSILREDLFNVGDQPFIHLNEFPAV